VGARAREILAVKFLRYIFHLWFSSVLLNLPFCVCLFSPLGGWLVGLVFGDEARMDLSEGVGDS